MIQAEKIAAVLGGEQTLKRRITTLRELRMAVSDGLPKSALRRCIEHVVMDDREVTRTIYKVVPEATYKRRRVHLKLEESERTERLARIIATAEHVWDDRDDARRFLLSPHPAFENRPLFDVAQTELGARQVEELLWNIYHGLPV